MQILGFLRSQNHDNSQRSPQRKVSPRQRGRVKGWE
jgi:hypothetical protein